MKRRKAVLLFGLIGLTLFLAVLAGALFLFDPFADARNELTSAVAIGMTESEVRAALGEPQFEYSAADAPEDYYVSGYSHRKRAISNKVHVYVTGEPICYVWYDSSNRVEDYFVGGS